MVPRALKFILRHPASSAAQIETDAMQALLSRSPRLFCPLATHASRTEHDTAWPVEQLPAQ
jgi:hypothetical protein